jgi:hypothetical protein
LKLELILEDDPTAATAGRAVVHRWLTWRAATALEAWRVAASGAARARALAARADAHRRKSLLLRGLVGLGLAVRRAQARRAAERHWAAATTAAVLRAWATEVWESKVRLGAGRRVKSCSTACLLPIHARCLHQSRLRLLWRP